MSKERKEHEDAAAELEAYFNKTRPRNLAEGVTSGVGDVIQGTVGLVGALVLGPVIGTTAGHARGGIIGGTLGLVGGAVGGVVTSVLVGGGGLLKGANQIVRGVASVPQSVSGPKSGKWWNDMEGKWIETNLENEAANLPKDDDDILGDAANKEVLPISDEFQNPNVKDPYYYDVLGVDSDADKSKIKKQYYLMAKKYHPDKAGDDPEAAEKFKDISEAYQVLSDPKLRDIYDEQGREGLSGDKTGSAHLENQPDPKLLFAFLFGSDKFDDYIGTLAMATSAKVEDKLPLTKARSLQVRRCTRIALKLAKKLESWINDDVSSVTAQWEAEAEELSKASFGYELIVLIGQVYSLAATQFLGSLDSGIGMPSISKWAKGRKARLQQNNVAIQAKKNTLKSGLDMAKANADAERKMAAATSDEEKKSIAESFAKEQLSVTLQIMWTITTVDVTSTIHEACQMVFFDKAVDKPLRKKRAEGVKKMGDIFMECPKVEKDQDASKLYEEAAFAAMLETIKRKEDSSFNASFSHGKE